MKYLSLFLVPFTLAAQTFDGKDTGRTKVPIKLTQIADGYAAPTDIQFVPNQPEVAIILEQAGSLSWLNVKNGKKAKILTVPGVLSHSELGLLGLAFHPRFAKNRKTFLHYSTRAAQGKIISRIVERTFTPQLKLSLTERVILEVDQPYSNHDAGQLAFGPDGFLYIGFGDGGSANDPHGHGQNTNSLLGTMIRINVDKLSTGKAYSVPATNPFVRKAGFRPEIWAWGLRNPWRYSFDRQGRLIVADVGQNRWEEVSVIQKGKNYGWNTTEGNVCFRPRTGCSWKGITRPVAVYGRADGGSITGGYTYYDNAIPALKGHYVFGDFLSGRLWAIQIPKSPVTQLLPLKALGKWPIQPSTFGRDAQGRLYVADFGRGRVFRIDP